MPDAEITPPENVLFVCKLNPATQENDLELIFSRYGPIRSIEVVRDWKTGQSLQYSFIEYETKQSCEEAYFNMENMLIDERRIHVDFCQSVQKYWKQYNKNKRKNLVLHAIESTENKQFQGKTEIEWKHSKMDRDTRNQMVIEVEDILNRDKNKHK